MVRGMNIKFHNDFKKHYKKVPSNIKKSFDKRIEVFRQDIFYPILNNHALNGKYTGLRSINITGDWRALYSEHDGGKLIIFHLINTHSELYK